MQWPGIWCSRDQTRLTNFATHSCALVIRVDGWMILKWIFKNWDGEGWTESIWLWVGTGAGWSECGDELLGLIKCGKFFILLRTSWFLSKDSAPWS